MLTLTVKSGTHHFLVEFEQIETLFWGEYLSIEFRITLVVKPFHNITLDFNSTRTAHILDVPFDVQSVLVDHVELDFLVLHNAEEVTHEHLDSHFVLRVLSLGLHVKGISGCDFIKISS